MIATNSSRFRVSLQIMNITSRIHQFCQKDKLKRKQQRQILEPFHTILQGQLCGFESAGDWKSTLQRTLRNKKL